jgi:hypothetical protein
MNEGSIGRHLDSLPINSLLVNSLLRYWLPPALWMGVIFVLSAQPSLPHHPDTLLDLILKKAAHMIEYGILASLLWRALSRGRPGSRPLSSQSSTPLRMNTTRLLCQGGMGRRWMWALIL